MNTPKILIPHLELNGIDTFETYRKNKGFEALETALQMNSPQALLSTLKESGLRERSHTGFPVGLHWEFVAAAPDEERVVILNADEGEPGCFKDRYVCEKSPFLVLEAMLITGFTVGAKRGFLFLRREFSAITKKLTEALKQLHENNLLGKNILKSSFSFEIEIILGAGGYTFGDERIVLETLEGRKGQGRIQHPYPTIAGFHEHPTLIGDLETILFVPFILRNGSKWFRNLGIPSFPGTTLFCVSGRIQTPGIYEVPIGSTIEQILSLAGGALQGEKVTAVSPGGVGSSIIPQSLFSTPLEPSAMSALDLHFGNGALIVYSDRCCLVDIALHITKFFAEESCGRCAPCREGTRRLHETIRKLTDARFRTSAERTQTRPELALPALPELLKRLGETLRLTSRCSFGRRAAAAVEGIIRYFPEEFNAHLVRQECRQGVCRL
ncbi:MAG: NADH-ubiquinone oxidoreductase-F iron-sulfur binding region domain-containing protein [Candidatus Ozemobacteraceae bacterium]